MRALAIFFGVILLLPGLCAIVSMAAFGSGGDGVLGLLWLLCFAISFGGVMLILRGGRKRPPPPASPPE
jgi:hypothetical protein